MTKEFDLSGKRKLRIPRVDSKKFEKEFDLSEKIREWLDYKEKMINVEDVKDLITLIQSKVIMNWKGQNEFIDWLKSKVGGKLWK